MEFTKQSFAEFRKDFAEAMESLEAKHNIKVSLGGISYGSTEFTSKVTVVNVEEGSESKSASEIKMENDFKKHAHLYDLKPEDLGKTFRFNGQEFKLIGLKPRSPKYPFIGKDASGSQYKFPEQPIVDQLS